MNAIRISQLGHVWLVDLDGTLLRHNGYKTEAGEELQPGVGEFWAQIPEDDMVILISARTSAERERTLSFLDRHGLRYDQAIFDAPMGERILINDCKPSGLQTALAVNLVRDQGLADFGIQIDPGL